MYMRQKELICDRVYKALRFSEFPLTIYGVCEDAGCYKHLARFAILDLIDEGFVEPEDMAGDEMTFKVIR